VPSWYDEIEGRAMNLILTLTDSERAKLLAKARAEGTTPECVVRHAIEPILASVPDEALPARKPKESLLGIWAQYGSGPSEEEIDQNRADMFATFGRDDIA